MIYNMLPQCVRITKVSVTVHTPVETAFHIVMFFHVLRESAWICLLALPTTIVTMSARYRSRLVIFVHHIRLGGFDALNEHVLGRRHIAVTVSEMLPECMYATVARLASDAMEIEDIIYWVIADKRVDGGDILCAVHVTFSIS